MPSDSTSHTERPSSQSVIRSSRIPGPSDDSKLALIQEDDDHQVLIHRNLIITLWRGQVSPRICHTLIPLSIEVAGVQGTSQVSAISIVDKEASPPDPAAREALARLHEGDSSHVHRVAVVRVGGGFIEAGIRSIVLGIRRSLAGARGSLQMHGNLEQALSWVTEGLATSNGKPIDIKLVLRELESYRKR